ncbi:terminase [Marichromatium purpuratum 984]|uniref:Terminase n=1 Tax=Marichromatium purpuratum 984 TaxID=765910 RepID=W0E4D8_MARPU|nr:phage terminase large subunit family protein [Marichromatium purpuratum]AHF04079.1 terminase [Marichromatium purpuratum 984]
MSLDTDGAWAMRELSSLLRPRVHLSVSEWADAYRLLSPKASSEPGPWRTARTPYLREIMDALSATSDVERIVVMKSAQLGLTEAAVNWIGYIMDQVRTAKPTLIVVPTDRLLVRWRHQRLNPMIEGAECLRSKIDISKSREGSNRLDLIDYPGGLLYLTTAGSASNLKSDSLCYVICDEADEYAWDVDGRGDPLGLIESRQSNFPRRKLLIFSTPTVKGSSRIEGEWERSDQRRYHVVCPHCGERQALVWEHLHWNADVTQVWYACAHNGCVIEERDKPALLAGGEWIATHPGRRVRGYHLSALYAPLGLGYSWRELATQWVEAADSDERRQHFTNERLGLPWEDRRTNVDLRDLAARAEPYPLREAQPGVGLITAGIDTQDDRLAVQIVGWGEGGRWWVLDYIELPGDPARPEVWIALTDLLGRAIHTAHGIPIPLEGAAIDMAGHNTEHVKAYVRGCRLPRVIAITGSRYRLDRPLGPARKIDHRANGQTIKHGMRYHQVGTELAKDRLYADLRADADQPPPDRRAHFSQDLPPEYLAGLLSETWNPKRQRYEPKRGMTKRNEPLDTWVYAYAVAHHPEIRLDRLRPSDWERRVTRFFGSESKPESSPSKPASEPQPMRPVAAPPSPPRRSNFVQGWKR